MCNASNHPPGCTCGWGWGSYGGGHVVPRRLGNQGYIDYVKSSYREIYESFTVPNARCPVCGAHVFYYQSTSGGRVYFDELGPPWSKHPCTDNAISNSSKNTAMAIKPKEEASANSHRGFFTKRILEGGGDFFQSKDAGRRDGPDGANGPIGSEGAEGVIYKWQAEGWELFICQKIGDSLPYKGVGVLMRLQGLFREREKSFFCEKMAGLHPDRPFFVREKTPGVFDMATFAFFEPSDLVRINFIVYSEGERVPKSRKRL